MLNILQELNNNMTNPMTENIKKYITFNFHVIVPGTVMMMKIINSANN